MSIPSMEETCSEIVSNDYLRAIISLARSHQRSGFGGVDCIDSMVAGDVEDEEEHNSPQQVLMDHIEGMTYAEKQAVIPYLRRLGYSLLSFGDEGGIPFSIYFPGHAPCEWDVRVGLRHGFTYLHATSPGMLRLRGVLWCLPRLLAWKWRAVHTCWAPPDGRGYKRLLNDWRARV